MKLGTTAVLLAALLGLSSGRTLTQETNGDASNGGGWQAGRATLYGGSATYLQNFPSRGPPPEYGFGTPLYGSCGYLSQAGNEGVGYSAVPFPVDTLAAAANLNDDYPGSCGRCYEVRCATGTVVGNFSDDGTPIPFDTSRGFSEPGLDRATLQDSYGRTYAGNPLEDEDQLFTQCWNDTLGLTTPEGSIYIVVTDNCPCDEGRNPPCCGNAPQHFDLSFFAFEKIAHPIYGVMNLEFRPVACDTREPLTYEPGFINQTIYSDNAETGWAWTPYNTLNRQLQVPGAGVGGSNATCVDIEPQGGLTFVARASSASGYQPFAGANTLTFWVKQTSSEDLGGEATAPVPSNVEVSIGNADDEYYCQGQQLSSLAQGSTEDGLTELTVPVSAFNCELERVQQVGFQNLGSDSVAFCLDQIALDGTPSGGPSGESASPQGDYPGPVTPLTAEAV